MKEFISFSLNGRATSVHTFVKNKLAHVLSASNHWSSTENNSNNSWNINFNDGNSNNNNNKYNSNVCRAVAALGEEEIISWIEASDDCCRHKKTSLQCTLYRIRYEEELLLLALSVKLRKYHPTTSDCFVVKYPKLREIFAANFIDRIVQHWIILRAEPLLEELFISNGDVSFNCRKGYGTLRAVQTFSQKLEEVTEGWTKEAWIGRFDLSSFFMSIDKQLLWQLFEKFLNEHYKGNDIDTLLWLSEITIKHRPQDDCIRKGDISLWDRLPHNKSLFYTNGTPIGNITSQILANFLLSEFDAWALNYCRSKGGWYVRFVDDFPTVFPQEEDLLTFHKDAEIFLMKLVHLSLHPDKVYIQPARHGIKFVGTVIMPNRCYLSNRTIGKMYDMLLEMDNLCRRITKYGISLDSLIELDHYVCACNSYMGFLKYNSSYSRKWKLFGNLQHFWKCAYVSDNFNKVCLKRQYMLSCYLLYIDNKYHYTLNKQFKRIQEYGNSLFSKRACTTVES